MYAYVDENDAVKNYQKSVRGVELNAESCIYLSARRLFDNGLALAK